MMSVVSADGFLTRGDSMTERRHVPFCPRIRARHLKNCVIMTSMWMASFTMATLIATMMFTTISRVPPAVVKNLVIQPSPQPNGGTPRRLTTTFRPATMKSLSVQLTSVGVDSLNQTNSSIPVFSQCEKDFIEFYTDMCEKYLGPRASNIAPSSMEQPLCPCIPEGLLGSQSIEHDLSTNDTDFLLEPGPGELTAGGRWRPTSCIARHRVAIIVPFRNRESHLQPLLLVLHQVLRRQLLDFTIFIIEQLEPRIFNRGALQNVGFIHAMSTGDFDCLMLHDVDMMPKNDLNFYACSPFPRHVGMYRDHRVYSYKSFFGGIVAISPAHFKEVNGFSNKFYGWGSEDDDFRRRVLAKQLKLAGRFPECVSRYKTHDHELDNDNPLSSQNKGNLEYISREFDVEGLVNLQYDVVRLTNYPLYTRVSINLPNITRADQPSQ